MKTASALTPFRTAFTVPPSETVATAPRQRVDDLEQVVPAGTADQHVVAEAEQIIAPAPSAPLVPTRPTTVPPSENRKTFAPVAVSTTPEATPVSEAMAECLGTSGNFDRQILVRYPDNRPLP